MLSYNRLAPFYDVLSFLVFGDKLNASQAFLTRNIKQGDRVLILGGGTGKLLEFISLPCHVTFVDASSKMIEKARLRKTEAELVYFAMYFEDFVSHEKFDHVFCPYFLDLFDPDSLEGVLFKIKMCLKENAMLHVADFNPIQTSAIYYKVLMWCMLKFFKFTTGLKPTTYNGMFELLGADEDLCLKEEESRCKDFVQSKSFKIRV